ncbi:hypothetical protein ASG43_13720 [Aureimonas sp. Leaf454]|uniref:hypothetical protein n=1 Tax=Aureimonas sp. Leaf454 TaxID=1736381 RepID=UPI0006FFB64E|nr:hypothetical protein [Aureimonas sp. Leaf454]KQT44408.1 hypothetical protein ASG43_13720 [Aureimonas sp. Leaf454]
MSLHASGRQKRPARPAPVIDGEAILVSRRPLSDPFPAKAAAAQPASAIPNPRTSNRPEATADGTLSFGRRAANRRPPAPDLVFPGERTPVGSTPMPAPRRGLSVFSAVADFSVRTRDRRAAGLAGALALLVLPLMVLSAPIGPAVATPGGDSLVLDELVTSISPRGAGAVLTVSGRIRNMSEDIAAVPPLRIALAEPSGGVRSKSLVTGVATLRAGHGVRFHSSVAVAKETRGKIEVNLIATGSTGKTRFE